MGWYYAHAAFAWWKGKHLHILMRTHSERRPFLAWLGPWLSGDSLQHFHSLWCGQNLTNSDTPPIREIRCTHICIHINIDTSIICNLGWHDLKQAHIILYIKALFKMPASHLSTPVDDRKNPCDRSSQNPSKSCNLMYSSYKDTILINDQSTQKNWNNKQSWASQDPCWRTMIKLINHVETIHRETTMIKQNNLLSPSFLQRRSFSFFGLQEFPISNKSAQSHFSQDLGWFTWAWDILSCLMFWTVYLALICILLF